MDKDKIVEIDENTLVALTSIINMKDSNQMPKGLDNFRIMNRLSKAFDKAEKTNVLKLENLDYKFLKDLIEHDIPSNWGRNQDISNAVEAFLNPNEE